MDDNPRISDECVEAVLKDLVVSREKRRRIQAMNRDELQRYLTNLYKIGVEDGAGACYRALKKEQAKAESVDEVAVDWDDVLNVIAQVQGVGENLVSAIDNKLREVYA